MACFCLLLELFCRTLAASTRRAQGELNHKSSNDRLVSKALVVDIFQAERACRYRPCFERGEEMADPYIEDDGAEFPINNCVQCGQTEYVAGFGEDQVKTGKIKSMAPRATRSKFLPKVAAPSRK